MAITLRPSSPEDAGVLREIERSAGRQFRDVGDPNVADDEPSSADELSEYANAGRSWVAVDAGDNPIGYVLVDVVDGNAHVEQISVLPDHQGAGIGRALLEQVSEWATSAGLPAITLTTFKQVPWNAPLYRHLGFRVLDEDEIGPELRTVRETEAAHGLDPTQRVCMRKDLRQPSGT